MADLTKVQDSVQSAQGGDAAALLERVVLGGDLSKLNPAQRLQYYAEVCRSVGLNPLTKPFEYLELKDEKGNPKLILYARREATDQLRSVRNITITSLERDTVEGVFIVTVAGRDKDGREDVSTGAVPLVKEGGEWETYKFKGEDKRRFKPNGTFTPLGPTERANAMMKAETKAKRRLTLSLAGLGMLDETEIEDMDRPAPERIVSQPRELEPVDATKPIEKRGDEKPSGPTSTVPTWPEVLAAWTDAVPLITELEVKALFKTAYDHGWSKDELLEVFGRELQVTKMLDLPGGKPLEMILQIVKAPR